MDVYKLYFAKSSHDSWTNRSYTRGALKNPNPFIVIGWDHWSNKRDNHLIFIEVKGGGKDLKWSAKNAALFVDLLWDIFYSSTNRKFHSMLIT